MNIIEVIKKFEPNGLSLKDPPGPLLSYFCRASEFNPPGIIGPSIWSSSKPPWSSMVRPFLVFPLKPSNSFLGFTLVNTTNIALLTKEWSQRFFLIKRKKPKSMDKIWIPKPYNLYDHLGLPSLFSVWTVGISCIFVGSPLRFLKKKQDQRKRNSRTGIFAYDLS